MDHNESVVTVTTTPAMATQHSHQQQTVAAGNASAPQGGSGGVEVLWGNYGAIDPPESTTHQHPPLQIEVGSTTADISRQMQLQFIQNNQGQLIIQPVQHLTLQQQQQPSQQQQITTDQHMVQQVQHLPSLQQQAGEQQTQIMTVAAVTDAVTAATDGLVAAVPGNAVEASTALITNTASVAEVPKVPLMTIAQIIPPNTKSNNGVSNNNTTNAGSPPTGMPRLKMKNERVYCDICHKTFSCGANLRDHKRLHTGEKPYKCSECNMQFAQRSNWRLHKRVHTGEKPYMCGFCGKTFARSSHLPGHVRIHTGEKPYQCEECLNCFPSAQALKNHIRTHTGEKPFQCSACLTSFTHSSSLSSHKKKCTGVKRKRGRPVGTGRKSSKKKAPSGRPRGRPKKKIRTGRGRKKLSHPSNAYLNDTSIIEVGISNNSELVPIIDDSSNDFKVPMQNKIPQTQEQIDLKTDSKAAVQIKIEKDSIIKPVVRESVRLRIKQEKRLNLMRRSIEEFGPSIIEQTQTIDEEPSITIHTSNGSLSPTSIEEKYSVQLSKQSNVKEYQQPMSMTAAEGPVISSVVSGATAALLHFEEQQLSHHDGISNNNSNGRGGHGSMSRRTTVTATADQQQEAAMAMTALQQGTVLDLAQHSHRINTASSDASTTNINKHRLLPQHCESSTTNRNPPPASIVTYVSALDPHNHQYLSPGAILSSVSHNPTTYSISIPQQQGSVAMSSAGAKDFILHTPEQSQQHTTQALQFLPSQQISNANNNSATSTSVSVTSRPLVTAVSSQWQ